MDAFWVEKLIADKLEFSRLFESCISIIDGVYKLLVLADDTQLSGRDIYLVKDNIIQTELFDLQAEGNLSPGGVLVLAIADACERLTWVMVFYGKLDVLTLFQAQFHIVVLFDT